MNRIGMLVGAMAVAAALAIGSWRSEVAAQAASGGPLPVAVIDMVKVFNECDQWKAIKDLLEKKTQQHNAEAEKRKEEITAKTAELDAYHPDKPEWAKCREEVARLRISAGVWAELQKNRFDQLQKQWVDRNYADISKAVAQVAQKRGLALVLVRDEIQTDAKDYNQMFAQILNRKVVYHSAGIDITEEVMKLHNEQFKLRGGADALNFE